MSQYLRNSIVGGIRVAKETYWSGVMKVPCLDTIAVVQPLTFVDSSDSFLAINTVPKAPAATRSSLLSIN
jgi:hypothetical protein